MGLANKFMKPMNAKKLDRAFDLATEIMNSTKDPTEILRKAGIQRSDLTKAQQLLNNPMAGMITKALGVNKEEIASGLNRVESLFGKPATSSTEQAPVDEIQRLQSNLSRIK